MPAAAGLLRDGLPQWMRSRAALEFNGSRLIVRAENAFLTGWLQRECRDALAERLREIGCEGVEIQFETAPANSGAVRAGPPCENPAREGQGEKPPAKLEPAPRKLSPIGPAAGLTASGPQRRGVEMSDLVLGRCNAAAADAVHRCCGQNAAASGSLFVFGPVGTGKSHLLQGGAALLRRRQPQRQVMQLTAEEFANHFTEALRAKSMPSFRTRMRSVDALFVDDVEFFEEKPQIEEEFANTLQALEGRGKLVVLTADRHPRQLTRSLPELRSRYQAGPIFRIESPDFDTRLKIAEAKARQLDAEIRPEAVRYVAETFVGAREIFGALLTLEAQGRMLGVPITRAAAQKMLQQLERECVRPVRLTDVEEVVCELFGVGASRLRSKSRERALSQPRMLAMYLARKLARAAYAEIGRHFGQRNHSTVMAAEDRIHEWIEQDREIRVAQQSWPIRDLIESLERRLLVG